MALPFYFLTREVVRTLSNPYLIVDSCSTRIPGWGG
ncbi:hypothetical protein Vi05172_g12023 [Venturia inaequalis]|nr:hypothetical protein Vi05172_g12023 [Venturia inaequalis]